jgi:hypothetical protein
VMFSLLISKTSIDAVAELEELFFNSTSI